MLKKTIKAILAFILSIAITVSVLVMYDKNLEKRVISEYNSALGSSYGVDEMNKGTVLLEQNARRGDLIILGSSELNSAVPQNPREFFPNNKFDYNVNLVGRAGAQSLLNTIRVGALSEDFKDKKVVFVVSMQWFFKKEIDKPSTKAHFSEVQFYDFMDNDAVSKPDKEYVCNRFSNLISEETSLAQPYLYSKLYSKGGLYSSFGLTWFKPYYYLSRKPFVNLKDTFQSYNAVKRFKDYPKVEVKDINWDDEEAKAVEMGKSVCTNNSFYVMDSYYDTYLAPGIDAAKNRMQNIDLLASNEFGDYDVFLKTCVQTGVKPYVVFMSSNGWYYDYMGLSREKRHAFFDKLCEITEKNGFDYLDLRDKEYEPYFLMDVMHLGWGGWLHVNKKITEYFS